MSQAPVHAKNFVALNITAALSTLSQAHEQFPFGSLVPYDIDEEGRIVIFISLISEHYKNLAADPRASIFIIDPFGLDDPQAHGRATVLARFLPVPEEETEPVSARYFTRFPESPARSLVHDFVFFRGTPERVRWIGGFGDIRWIEGAKFRTAPFDPVAYLGRGMIDHMNEDHLDALQKIAAANGHDASGSFRMVSIDGAGFRIAAERGKRRSFIDVSFPEIVRTPDEVRRAIVALIPRS